MPNVTAVSVVRNFHLSMTDDEAIILYVIVGSAISGNGDSNIRRFATAIWDDLETLLNKDRNPDIASRYIELNKEIERGMTVK